MRIRFTFAILFFSFLVFNACQNDPEHEPDIQRLIDNPQENNSLADFEKKIRNAVLPDASGDGLQNSIYEGLGTIFMDAFVTFETTSGENIGFIPVFREDSDHTEAVIIASLKDDIPHYAFLERGQLYPYELWNSFINGFPTVNVMADLFVSFDRSIFQSTNSSIRDIIGTEVSGQRNEVAPDLNIDNSNRNNIKSEWEGTEICEFTFTGTAENPYQYLTDIDCYTVWRWESVPSAPVILDAGGSGGGGNNTLSFEEKKKAAEARMNNITDPEERRKFQLQYLKDYGGQAGKDFATMVETILSTPGLTIGDVWEFNKIVQKATNALINNYLSAILATPSLIAKPFIELALTNGLTNIALTGISAVVKSKFGIDLANSIKGIQSMPTSTTTAFKLISTSKKMVEFEIGLTKSNFMNNLSRASGKNWTIVNSEATIFNLEHNGISYTARTFSQTSGATIDVYKVSNPYLKTIIAKYRLIGN